MKKLSSKTALITGGTSGIGLAAARLFQQEGAHVAVTGRNPERLAEAREALGDEALIIASDAGNLTDIEALMGTVEENLGRLDVLFLNAAVAKGGPLEQVSENDFDEQIAVNVKGVFFALQKALPLLNPGASVIVTTSIANRLGTPNASVYAASKAALRSLVQALALELIGRGIRVNAVCPGPIDTPMYEHMGLPADFVRQRKAKIQERSPYKRFGSPDEAARVVLFLASEDSAYVVGEEIVVDGGMSIAKPEG